MLRFSAYFNRRLGTHPRVSHAEIISLFYGTPWMTWDLIRNNMVRAALVAWSCCANILIEAVVLYIKLPIAILWSTYANLVFYPIFIPWCFLTGVSYVSQVFPILFLSTWQYRKINLHLVDQFTASSMVNLIMLTGGELSYFLLAINHTFVIISLFRLILKNSNQFEKFYSTSITHDALTNAFLHSYFYIHYIYKISIY